MKKTTIKIRIISGILFAVTLFSITACAVVSTHAAEVEPPAKQTDTSTDKKDDPYSNESLYEALKKIVNKDKEEAARKEREEAADTRGGKTVVIVNGEEKEYENFYEAWTKATAASEATIKLNSNLSGIENLIVPAGVKLTVNLKGHTLSAQGPLFKINKGADCTISKGNINNAATAVIANGSTKLEGLCVSGATDSAVKGGEGAPVVIDGCNFRSNKGVQGGAVYLPYYAERTVIKNSVFEDNTSEKEGGAVYTNRGLINCTFKRNESGTEGGALYVVGNKEYIRNSTFEKNLAKTNGGAAAVSQDTTNFDKCVMNENKAQHNGGALYAPEQKDLVVSECKLDGNNAGKSGGGIYASYRSFLGLSYSKITNNTASELGGGIYLGALLYKDHAFNTVVITGNSAKLAGGVYADASVASAADIQFYKEIVIKDNVNNDMYLMKDCGKKAKIYTQYNFDEVFSCVYVNSSDSDEIAVVELDNKEHEAVFHANAGRSLSRGFLFYETLYIK